MGVKYKGEEGTIYQDGQTLVFKVDGKEKEYELGNVNDIIRQMIKVLLGLLVVSIYGFTCLTHYKH